MYLKALISKKQWSRFLNAIPIQGYEKLTDSQTKNKAKSRKIRHLRVEPPFVGRPPDQFRFPVSDHRRKDQKILVRIQSVSGQGVSFFVVATEYSVLLLYMILTKLSVFGT